MPYIYATALADDIVKLGRSTNKYRALAAQTYCAQTVQVLALWRTSNDVYDEDLALFACKHWHVRGELFRVPVPPECVTHPIVALLTDVLGAPMPYADTPQWRPHGGIAGESNPRAIAGNAAFAAKLYRLATQPSKWDKRCK